MSSVEKTILDLVGEICPEVEAGLTRETLIEDSGIASLDFVEIVFAIEDRFDVQIPYNANLGGSQFRSVGQLIDVVDDLITKRLPA